VKVKVKGHVIRTLSWILGMSYSVIDGLVVFITCSRSLFVCLLVGWLIRSFVSLVLFSGKLKVRFSSASVPHFTVNLSEVKVEVQGQNRCSENLPVVIDLV